MSEYQYYEFRVLDHPLTAKQMQELRSISTRAEITPTSFCNSYHFGNFKGDPEKMMEDYFDAHVYVANWGTREFMLHIPEKLIDEDVLNMYCCGDNLSYWVHADHIILKFYFNDESGDWYEDEAGEDWLPSLISLRNDIMRGDFRSLYFGWLSCAEQEQIDEKKPQAPVPANLKNLNAALTCLADFLHIPNHLIAAAAQSSADATESVESNMKNLMSWFQDRSSAEKENLFLDFMSENAAYRRLEILREIEKKDVQHMTESHDTISFLLKKAEEILKENNRQAAEKAKMEKEIKEKAEAEARRKYLNDLAGRETSVWSKVDALVNEKKAKEYEQAVSLLKDLKDLAAQKNITNKFVEKLAHVRSNHSSKSSFIKRIDEAKL